MSSFALPLTSCDPNFDPGYIAGSDSPTSPPFSPITPVMSNEFPPQSSQRNSGLQAPEVYPLQPFSESDNPDAIAVRSAISILQIQRQQALRDLMTLEQQKKLAAADPKAFTTALIAGEVKEKSTESLSSQKSFPPHSYNIQEQGDEQAASDTETCQKTRHPAFGDIPGEQDIVRCPPINWAKYHVLGQPLDVLHEEQRRRPVDGQHKEEGHRGEEHVIAGPYNPLKDRLAPNSTTTISGNGSSNG
ncbi:MAG: hypothetical protein Q9209_002468 [Squamulea sp. 1 TL-2023]